MLAINKNEESKKKVIAKIVDFPQILIFNISATEWPIIEIKFSALDFADQGLQHIKL